MRNKLLAAALTGVLMVSAASAANAVVVSYVNNPTTNSSDWSLGVSGLGGSVNSNVNFDGHALGALNGAFYTGTDGVTLMGTGNFGSVGTGNGPGNGNNTTTPLSSGEGLHAPSNYLGPTGSGTNNIGGTVIIDFASVVLGVGFTSIDLWDPNQANSLTIEAFTGLGGTGASLGLFSNAQFNFQNNNTYFMGLTSSVNDIRSLVITHTASGGDTIGIDDIVFATSGTVPMPEPGTLALFGLGLAGLGFARRRKATV